MLFSHACTVSSNNASQFSGLSLQTMLIWKSDQSQLWYVIRQLTDLAFSRKMPKPKNKSSWITRRTKYDILKETICGMILRNLEVFVPLKSSLSKAIKQIICSLCREINMQHKMSRVVKQQPTRCFAQVLQYDIDSHRDANGIQTFNAVDQCNILKTFYFSFLKPSNGV